MIRAKSCNSSVHCFKFKVLYCVCRHTQRILSFHQLASQILDSLSHNFSLPHNSATIMRGSGNQSGNPGRLHPIGNKLYGPYFSICSSSPG